MFRSVPVRTVKSILRNAPLRLLVLLLALPAFTRAANAQTDCNTGSDVLDTAEPKGITPAELIQKFTANETKVEKLRDQYTHTEDLLVQTLTGNSVDGQFHRITQVSYDEKGKRRENVTYAEQSTLRGVTLSATDEDDIRQFMPWILTTDEASQYNLTYAGRQHQDDLDTYVFHVEPKRIDKNKRYFQGRVWIDDRDLELVKLCGKSAPEIIPKKHQPADVRPTFVGYREYIDGNWLPAYAKVDDTLNLGTDSIHLREIVKLTGYKRNPGTNAGSAR